MDKIARFDYLNQFNDAYLHLVDFNKNFDYSLYMKKFRELELSDSKSDYLDICSDVIEMRRTLFSLSEELNVAVRHLSHVLLRVDDFF